MHSRLAVASLFLANGVVLASWVPHIPAVKARHGLSDDQLGALLLCMAAGAAATLPCTGWLVARFGSRTVTIASGSALCALLPLPVLAPSAVLAGAALVLLGSANAGLDVSMNAQAIEVERLAGRPVMSSFHALFSLGGLVGAALAASAMAFGASDAGHVLAAAAAGLVVVALAAFGLVPSPGMMGPSGPVFVRPAGRLATLGLLAFCGLLAEGAMADWSAVYLHDALGATPAVAALGFAAFSGAMATGRLTGDRLVARFGSEGVLRTSAAAAALGLLAALLLGRPAAAVAGCAIVGLGIANVIPILFGAAVRVPGAPAGTAIAAVATAGYGGFLVGPPVIGYVAEATSLSAGLGLVAILCALVAVRAGSVR